jgi:pyruvate/2-oxoglutarate dehydrogenase complex dihydrolipoamide dehydrogenase (E3) component
MGTSLEQPGLARNHPLVEPLDEANRELLAQVHPPGWANPPGRGVYDLVVIGGGTAGLVSAAGAAGLGARVALVEKALLGGDCLNTGCVPSKALLRSARAVAEARKAPSLGVRTGEVEVDFGAVMARMRRLRAGISPHDSAARLTKIGVDVFLGQGRFSSPRTIDVDGRSLRFNRAVIATGGRASAPPIPGLSDVDYLTNETLFWLTELPSRLLVVGGGPIGSEMAQAFSRFGSRVTVFDASPHLLPREDADAAAIVQRRFVAEGIQLELGVTLTRVEMRGGEIVVHAERTRADGSTESFETRGDRILVAVGRAPNVDTLGLEAAGVAFTRQGVTVGDQLRTSNSRVFAAGDVCSRFTFTHAADAMARIVIQNALFYGRRKASALVIPWATYTDPEIAHVGFYEDEARKAGHAVETITVELGEVDRAILDDDTSGFVRVHHEKGRLLGCTIVSAHAGEMIGEASFALTHRGKLGQFSSTVHPYPTQSEAFRMVGDRYRRTALTPSTARWLSRYFRWTRGGSAL